MSELTWEEVIKILNDHYTVEELCDILELCPAQLLNEFESIVEERFDEICERISEDIGI